MSLVFDKWDDGDSDTDESICAKNKKTMEKAMGKFDLGSVISSVQKGIKDGKRKKAIKLGSELPTVSENPEDYVVLPEELGWQEASGLLGIPFGKITQIAGDSDSGKTSFAITAMKAAQEQGIGILYIETEGKTAPEDLAVWGVDPEEVMIVSSGVAEEAFAGMFDLWDGFFDKYPNEKLLVIIDSWGNSISMRDEGLDLTSQAIQPGGQAKTNRLSVNKMIAKMQADNVAVLVNNYTYDNMGSVGKTNAGGKALHFFTYIGYQTKRTGWVEKGSGDKRRRVGAKVRWTFYKNHAMKAVMAKEGRELPHHVDFEITKDGMKRIG